MKSTALSRRDLIKQFAAFGVGAPLAMNLAAIGAAAAATAPTDYKALVCIFLQGGNDSNNLLLATDADTWSRYWGGRWRGSDPIALMPPGTPKVAIGSQSAVTGRTVAATDNPEYWGGVLPITPKTKQPWPDGTVPNTDGSARSFALHPMLPKCQSLFGQGRLALLANVGTLLTPLTKAQYQAGGTAAALVPQRLFSHNDQQSAWQSGQVQGVATGWGGEIADTFAATAGAGLDFMSVTTAGSTPFPTGNSVRSYRVKVATTGASAETIAVLGLSGAYNNSPTMLAQLRATLLPDTATLTSTLAADYVDALNQSIQTASVFSGALAAGVSVPPPSAFTDPIAQKTADNPLADQLYAVAQTIAARTALSTNRQVFFVQIGSFDTHDLENKRQGLLLAQLDHALDYFDGALSGMGMGSAVTTFTASDFNRTFTTNGDGTDHAWGGHHLILGGAVKGGDIYGQYPTLGIDVTGGFLNPDGVGNALVPTTSVDQYLATMATWFGVGAQDLVNVFPRLPGFAKANLGFV